MLSREVRMTDTNETQVEVTQDRASEIAREIMGEMLGIPASEVSADCTGAKLIRRGIYRFEARHRIQAEKRNNALAVELRALGDPRRLDEIPIGLFMANGELCLKTEYREPNGAVSAFIVSSGEFFCGPSPQTVTSQNADTVTPVSLDFVLAALEGDE